MNPLAFSSRYHLPTVIPVGWTPPGGPMPYSRALIEQRSAATIRDAERDAQDAERFEYVLTDDGLVVRESVR